MIPAYNAEATLAETLSSVEAQTYRDFDLTIVDDGSTDATSEIAKAFCAKHSWARSVRQENQGVAAARNLGVSVSSGAYIAPIDADDVWHPKYLEAMVATIEAAKTPPVLVYAFSKVINRDSLIIGSGHNHAVNGDASRVMPFFNLVGNGSAMMVNRAVFMEAGGYDKRLRSACAEGCEDFLLQLKLASLGPIACTSEYLVGYRRAGTGMSACQPTMLRSSILARKLFGEWLQERGDPQVALSPSRHWVKSAEKARAGRMHLAEGKLRHALITFGQAALSDPFGMISAVAFKPVSAAKRLKRELTPNPSFYAFTAQSSSPSQGPRLVARRIRVLQSLDYAQAKNS